MYERKTMREPKSSVARLDRRTFTKGTLAAVVGLSLSTGSAAASEEKTADLLTGPDEEPVGTVTISETDGSLSVSYEITDEEYEIIETNLHVGEEVDDIPTNPAGNPVPGHFDHKSTYEDGTASDGFEVDVSELGDELVVAAHAKVRTEIEEEDEEEEGEEEVDDGDEPEDDEQEFESLQEDDDENGDDDNGDDVDNDDDDEEDDDDEDEEEEEEEIDYAYESAWADGERINQGRRQHPVHRDRFLGGEGSWATYVPYERGSEEDEEADDNGDDEDGDNGDDGNDGNGDDDNGDNGEDPE